VSVIVPKSRPGVSEQAPERAPVLDFAGAMPTRDPMADALSRGLSGLADVVTLIGEKHVRRETESLLIDAEQQMIKAYSEEKAKSSLHRADGVAERVSETFKTIGQDVTRDADPVVRNRFMSRWNSQSTIYTRAAVDFELDELDQAEHNDILARTQTDIYKLSEVSPEQRVSTLNDMGGNMVRRALVNASIDGQGPEQTTVELTMQASGYTHAYVQILAEESPGRAMLEAKRGLENFDKNPYGGLARALPPTNWEGKFPGSYPPGEGRLANANVRFTTVELDGRHYVIPSMIGGKLRDTDTNGSGRPDYLDFALKEGLDNYPWFSSEAEADEWQEANHGNVDKDGSWGKFTLVLTQKQFDGFERALAPRVEEESVAGSTSAIYQEYQNSPEQAYKAARDTEYPSKVRNRLKNMYAEDKAAKKEQTEQHDAPLVTGIRNTLAVNPRGPNAKAAVARAFELVSRIEDPKVHAAQEKLVNQAAAGELIVTDTFALEDFNARLEAAGNGSPGALRSAALTIQSEINTVDLNNDDYAAMVERLDAIINPTREGFEYDGKNGWKRIAGVGVTASDLFGKKPKNDTERRKKDNFERSAQAALLAEHMTGELNPERARLVVSEVANGYVDTHPQWFGRTEERHLTYAEVLSGGSRETSTVGKVGEIPGLISKQIHYEAGHTRTPSIDDISLHINGVWNRRIEFGLEASEDIGFAPAAFVDEYYAEAEMAESRLIPSRLNEKARTHISSMLGIPIGKLQQDSVERYIEKAWAQTRAEADNVWGDSAAPDVFWLNAHFDAIEGPRSTPAPEARGAFGRRGGRVYGR